MKAVLILRDYGPIKKHLITIRSFQSGSHIVLMYVFLCLDFKYITVQLILFVLA